MTTQASFLRNDAYLHPLYLKWAAENFREGSVSQGMSFFNAACSTPPMLEHKVYEKMWKVKGRPEGDPEFGRKSFHSLGGLSSTSQEKVRAIDKVLRNADHLELEMRQNQVHKCLWIIHRRPLGDLQYGKHAFYNTHGRFASIGDKLSAARMYADESRIFTWLTDRGQVQLIRRADGRLERLAIDDNSGQIGTAFFDTGGLSTEAVISFLSQCSATVNGGAVAFSMFQACQDWPDPIFFPGENRELRLLLKDNNLVWRLFDKTTKTVSWVYARSAEIHSIKQISETVYRQETPYFKDLKIQIHTSYLNRILYVYISKVQSQSVMDPKKTIDRDNWAITLINADTCGMDPMSWGGHAMIAYEGVKGGSPFLGFAHVGVPRRSRGCNEAIVEITDRVTLLKQGRNIKIHSQSETWIRTRLSIEVMEERIKGDVGKVIPFNPLMGAYSGKTFIDQITEFFNGSEPKDRYHESCLSWAISNVYSTGVILPFWENMSILPRAYVSHIACFPSLVKLENIFERLEPTVASHLEHYFSPSYYHRVSTYDPNGT